jgi:hypothetical protein
MREAKWSGTASNSMPKRTQFEFTHRQSPLTGGPTRPPAARAASSRKRTAPSHSCPAKAGRPAAALSQMLSHMPAVHKQLTAENAAEYVR